MADLTPAADHKVYPDGPPCTPDCPGAWSTYHDGYSWGYENGENAARASAEAEMREMARSIVRLGHDTGGVVCYCGVHEDARRILAATPAEPPTLPEPDLDIIDTTQQGEP